MHPEAVARHVEETKRIKFVVSVIVSRSASESSQASLRSLVVVNLPERAKPATLMEATASSTLEATRGSMEWRAMRGTRMNTGSPNKILRPGY